LHTHDPAELAKYCMEDNSPGFGKRDDLERALIVAGDNFGCGSSREHAPISIKAAGISCVIAESFSRIFLRNSINIGLPVIEIGNTSDFKEGCIIEIDFVKWEIINKSIGKKYKFSPYPEFIRKIIENGGWINYAKTIMKEVKI